MTIRNIISIPDPILREISKPVERIDAEVLRLLDDMAETMYEAPGIGLAAIQIGIPLRLVTIDVSKRSKAEEAAGNEDTEQAVSEETETEEKRETIFMINPRILKYSDERSAYEEGCLSIPDYYAEVERPAGCMVTFLDRDGKERVIDATGLLSTCIQHEVDHLDGLLFIDKLSRLKRGMVIRKFTKMARQNGKAPDGSMVG